MGDNPTTATDAHTVSSIKARLAVCAAKIIARLPVTVIVRLLKMFRPLQKSSSIQQALAVDAKVREKFPRCAVGSGGAWHGPSQPTFCFLSCAGKWCGLPGSG